MISNVEDNKTNKRVLAIDPGLNMGWALVYQEGRVFEHGLVKTSPELALWERLENLHQEIARLLPMADELAIERVSLVQKGGQHANTMALYWVYFEVIRLWKDSGPIGNYAPTTIKKCFTGNGRASKAEVKRLARERTHGKVSDHEADAIAIGLTHWIKRAIIKL